jgi:GT2 family glycosyltransferase
MSEQVAVMIVPRDRFSSVVECTEELIKNTNIPFRLYFLDFGYANRTLARLRDLTANISTEFIACGKSIPMQALKHALPKIDQKFLAWLDNDTFVTPGWLTALLERAAQGARVILPVTLEREGLDADPRKIPLRNHISHAELRRIRVDGVDYVFDYKPFRRAAPEELPQEPHTIDFFELHAFFAETDVLKQLDIPAMVVREHIDLGMQLHKMGIDIWCEPKSHVIFDNIHERPSYGDLKFFFYRWSERFIDDSHELFEKRWGYRFYGEQFMKNWAFRRKVFSVCRFMGLPHNVSDFASRVFNKLLRPPIPEKLRKDPLPESERILVRSNQATQPA